MTNDPTIWDDFGDVVQSEPRGTDNARAVELRRQWMAEGMYDEDEIKDSLIDDPPTDEAAEQASLEAVRRLTGRAQSK